MDIPLSLVLVGLLAWVLLWAANSGQFDNLEGPVHSVIMNDDTPLKPDYVPKETWFMDRLCCELTRIKRRHT